MALTNGNDILNVPLGETIEADGLAGTDTLVMDWSTLTGPISYYQDYWQWFTDDMNNSVQFRNFERFQLTGGAGGDDLRGGAQDDVLSGGGGDDVISSGIGADIVDGGAGLDQLRLNYEALGAVENYIQLLPGGATHTIASTNLQVRNVESLYYVGGAGTDIIDTSAVSGNVELYLRDGDDTAQPGPGTHYVNAEGGLDTLIMNYGAATSSVVRWDIGYGWNRFGDQDALTNYVEFANFERFQLTGGGGDDAIYGGNDNDILVGNAGNDILDSGGGLGVDVVNGGLGTDTWQFNLANILSVTVNISTAVGVASTGHTLTSIDQLSGAFGSGDDTVIARPGMFNDTVTLGDGNDAFSGGRGRDNANGGGGADDHLTVNWAADTTNIVWSDQGYGWQRLTSAVSQIDYVNFERFNILGGAGADELRGGSGFDTLTGGNGNDTLRSGTGDAVINGGGGVDFWAADLSAEVVGVNLNLTAGQTTSQGTAAGLNIKMVEQLELTTGAANDVINATGYARNDWLNLMGGDDTFNGGGGIDTVQGGANGGLGDLLVANFSASANPVQHTDLGYGWWRVGLRSGTQSVEYHGFERYQLTGGTGNDRLNGAGMGDTLTGGAGNDVLNGGGGNDVIAGGAGIDTWSGSHPGAGGALTLTLNPAGDGVLGGIGTTLTGIENVTLTTGVGNDVINTAAIAGGNENLVLGEGNDTANLGTGHSRVEMGGGNDLVIADFSTSATSVTMADLGYGWWRVTDGIANVNRVEMLGFDQVNLTGSPVDDRLRGFGNSDVLNGGSGNDLLIGYEGDDVLTGGGGDDIFRVWVGSGTDLVTDAATGDKVRVDGLSANGAVSVVSNDGATTANNAVELQVVGGETLLYIGRNATAGADVTVRLQGVFETGDFQLLGRDIRLVGDAPAGTPGDDVLTGTSGNDALSGGVGNDRLIGLAGDDVLDGGVGTDTLTGGMGADTLTGGADVDRFVYTSVSDSAPGLLYRDVLPDLVLGSEKIDLSAIDANPFVAGDQAFTWKGAAVFSGAAGQLHVIRALDLVEADVNGDAVADFQISLPNLDLINMVAADFML